MEITRTSNRTSDRFAYEANDCSVLAVQHALNVSYSKAHEMMAKIGRPNRTGVQTSKYVKWLNESKKFQKLDNIAPWGTPYTVRRLIEKHPDKKLVMLVRSHTFVVDKSVIKDYTDGLRRPVHGVWMVK